MVRKRASDLDETHWTLDRRVPLALILTLVLQAAAILTWATTLSNKVSVVEGNLRDIQAEMRVRSEQLNKLLILETELRFTREAISRIEARLEKSKDAALRTKTN